MKSDRQENAARYLRELEVQSGYEEYVRLEA
jgi:hypothetical protein